MDNFEIYGNKVETLESGELKITKPDGSTFILKGDGTIESKLSSIKSIGIYNIIDLKTHVIMREGELTVHQLEFKDGGKVKIAYTSDGKLVEFSGNNCGQSLSRENEILLRSGASMDKSAS